MIIDGVIVVPKNIDEYESTCGKAGCFHPICAGCGEALRGHHDRLADHPGSRQQQLPNVCLGCSRTYLLPRELDDEREKLLTDKQLARVKRESPHMYFWHMSRRRQLGLGASA